MKDKLIRCGWVTNDPDYISYHDLEWGVEIKDDQLLFEHLCLEVNQAGLSWLTVLKKRAHYRKLFYGFNIEKVARIGLKRVETLVNDPGIIRNRAKILAMVHNAKCFLEVQEEFGTFYDYSLRFIDGKRKVNHWHTLKEVPAATKESIQMSKDLKNRGFKFVGPTTIYAHMQAVGMVDDHLTTCYRHNHG